MASDDHEPSRHGLREGRPGVSEGGGSLLDGERRPLGRQALHVRRAAHARRRRRAPRHLPGGHGLATLPTSAHAPRPACAARRCSSGPQRWAISPCSTGSWTARWRPRSADGCGGSTRGLRRPVGRAALLVDFSAGGRAATANLPATAGGDTTTPLGGAGGGGGGLGRIRINTRDGSYLKFNTSIEEGALTTGSLSAR